MSNLCRADGTPANSRGPFTKGNMMETKDYLSYIVHEIHRTIVATVDDEGLPVTAAIDMMDCDDDSLYFLTAKGKGFYDRLIKRGFLAFTAMKGEDTMRIQWSVLFTERDSIDFGPALFTMGGSE